MESLNRIFEIARLISKVKTGCQSDAENDALQNWLAENERNREMYKKLYDGENLLNQLNELKKFDQGKAYKKVIQAISTEKEKRKTIRVIPGFVKYAAAVAVVVTCSYLIFNKYYQSDTSHNADSTILPGQQKAILITADNKEILLDISNKKQIIKAGPAEIVLSGSTLSYIKNDSADDSEVVTKFNTLITPRGGEYTVLLSDSTEVLLNAGSKLEYPIVFDKNNRAVALEGEAFFKVSKSEKKPFIVRTNDLNITVHGTKFNVTAYSNENIIQTTLVEGSVGVTFNKLTSESEIKIIPGEQLSYNKGTGNAETKEVNTERFIAWTKGKFIFENEPIENILKIMSRWYDFDYKFNSDDLKDQRFTLSLDRYDDANKILDFISISSKLKFKTEGQSVVVSSK